jgi:hypothetical protein
MNTNETSSLKTNNLFFIIPIGIALLFALGGFLTSYISYSSKAEDLMHIGISVIEFVGLFMLLLNGTFIKTKYSKIAQGIFAIVIVGSLFTIMHWPYGTLILVSGFAGIVIVYFLSFLKKPIKNRLDILKLAWVVVSHANGLLVYFHIIGDEYQILQSVLMWLAIIEYLRAEKRRGRLFS